MADINVEEVERMFEEDADLFEEEFDMEEKSKIEQKAFELGKKIGKVMDSKPVVIGKKIAKGVAIVGGAILIYKKGFSDGANSVAVDEIDNMYDDPEFEELQELIDAEETTDDEQ